MKHIQFPSGEKVFGKNLGASIFSAYPSRVTEKVNLVEYLPIDYDHDYACNYSNLYSKISESSSNNAHPLEEMKQEQIEVPASKALAEEIKVEVENKEEEESYDFKSLNSKSWKTQSDFLKIKVHNSPLLAISEETDSPVCNPFKLLPEVKAEVNESAKKLDLLTEFKLMKGKQSPSKKVNSSSGKKANKENFSPQFGKQEINTLEEVNSSPEALTNKLKARIGGQREKPKGPVTFSFKEVQNVRACEPKPKESPLQTSAPEFIPTYNSTAAVIP